MAGLTVKIGADASQFEKTMRGVIKQISGVKNSIVGIAGATGAVFAVNKAFDLMKDAAQGAFAFIKESSKEAAIIESLTTQFSTLLGGMGKAKERMEEITKFAASTPFEIKELAATSKQLESLTKGFLATGDGLRMVGDAASVAGQPIGEVATHIGRLFQGLTSGRSAGKSIARLQELGPLTGDMRTKFENLAEAQKKGEAAALTQAQAFAMLKEAFKNTEGAMAKLAGTTNGKLSNLQGNIDQLQAKFGAGFNDGLKDVLDVFNNFLPKLGEVFTKTGEVLGTAISESVKGNTAIFEEIGVLIGETIRAGMKAGLQATGETAAGGLLGLAKFHPLTLAANKISGGKVNKGIDIARGNIEQGTQIGIQKNVRDASSNMMHQVGRIVAMADEARKGGGVGFIQQAQERLRSGLSGIPGASTNPFDRSQEIAILRQIEQHFGRIAKDEFAN